MAGERDIQHMTREEADRGIMEEVYNELQIMEEERRAALPPETPVEQVKSPFEIEIARTVGRTLLLPEIAAQVQAIKNSKAFIDDLVIQAREAGVTWQEIAEAAGMHQPGAIRKWGKMVREQAERQTNR